MGQFGEYFPKTPPARAVLGVARVPDPPIQINAVAVRNLAERKAVNPPNYVVRESASPGVLTHDRLFVSGMLGTDNIGKVPYDSATQVDLALDRLQAVVRAAGLELSNMVFVNPYLTQEIPMRVMNERYARRFEFGNSPARATIEVSSLPGNAHIEYTGIAVRDMQQRRAVRPKNMAPSPTASPVFSPARRCIGRPRAVLFRDRTAGSLRTPHNINSGRPCATSSIILKKLT